MRWDLRKESRDRVMAAVVAAVVLAAVYSYGQAVNATLLGTVTDSSGAAIANAKITITEVNTGVAHSGQANESGNYTFPALPPGRYSVAVESRGFKRELREGERDNREEDRDYRDVDPAQLHGPRYTAYAT